MNDKFAMRCWPAKSKLVNLTRRIIDYAFGFDIFISYAWADGRAYAEILKMKLEQQGFTCFLDSENYFKGEDWKIAGRIALKRTQTLIVVGSKEAIESTPVLQEVEFFSKLNRTIIPIDVDGSFLDSSEDCKIFHYVKKSVLTITENSDVLTNGPTDNALDEIRLSFKGVKQNIKRVRLLAAISLCFAIIAMIAIYSADRAVNARDEALRQANIAKSRELVLRAEGLLDSQLDLSMLLGAEAVRQHPTYEAQKLLIKALTKRPFLKRFIYPQINEGSRQSNYSSPMALSNDGSKIAVTTILEHARNENKNKVSIIDTTTLSETYALPKEIHGEILSISVSHNANYIAINAYSDSKYKIMVWDTKNNIRIFFKEYNGTSHRFKYGKVVISRNGKTLSVSKSYSAYGKALLQSFTELGENKCKESNLIWPEVYDVKSMEHIKFPEQVFSMHIQHHGNELCSNNGRNSPDIDLTITNELIHVLGLTPNGKTLAVRNNYSIYLINIPERKLIGELEDSDLSSDSIAFSYDNKLMATVTKVHELYEQSLSIWNIDKRTVIKGLNGNWGRISAISFSKDNRWIAFAGETGEIFVFDIISGKETPTLLKGHKDSVRHITFLNNNALFSQSSDGELLLWDLSSPYLSDKSINFEHKIDKLAGSPSGKSIALRVGEEVKLWDIESHNETSLYNISGASGNGLIFANNGQSLSAGNYLFDIISDTKLAFKLISDNGIIGFLRNNNIFTGHLGYGAIWDANIIDIKSDVKKAINSSIDCGDPPSPVNDAIISHKGDHLFCYNSHGAYIHSIENGAMLPVDGKTNFGHVSSAIYTRNGDGIIVGGSSGHIFRVDYLNKTTSKILMMQKHERPVTNLCLSPNGIMLASASDRLRLWNNEKKELLGEITYPGKDTTGLAFNSDNTILISAHSKQLLSWKLDPESLALKACKAVSRNLTRNEWKAFFPNLPYHKTMEFCQ